jgi:transglutaminase/protease-like cytokinesis protein 3
LNNRKQNRWKILLLPLLLFSLFLGGCSSEMSLLDDETEETEGSEENNTEEGDDSQETQLSEAEALAYAYSHISEEEQQAYQEMLDCIESYEESVTLTTQDEDVMDHAFSALMSDRGDIFYVDGYSYVEYTDTDGELLSLDFEPNYSMTSEEKSTYEDSISEVINSDYLSKITDDMTDYEKALTIFETMIEEVSYQEDAEQNQNIISTFLYGQTVCQGYASAYQYLMNQLGIPSFIVSGKASGTAHAWNMIYLDGNWYNVDVTWGNASYSLDGQETAESQNYANYAYFCISNELLYQTHEVEMSFELPQTPSNHDNYYVHEGLYFTELDTAAIDQILSQAYSDQSSCSIMLDDEETFQEVFDYYITEENITEPCPEITTISYIQDPDCHVLIFDLSGQE